MSDETRSALRQAFDAIEAGELDTARTILEPVLAAEPDNVDAWWVFSHAVTDPQEAFDALENVVRIDPQYPGAAELLTTLRDRLPRRQAPPPPPPPIDIPDLPGDEPDFALPPSSVATPAPEPQEEESRSRLIPILAGVLLIIVIIALVYSLLSRSQNPPATPTAVALATLPSLVVTDEATPDATAEAAAATESAPVAEATDAATAEATDAASTVEAAATETALIGDTTAEAPTAEVALVDATPTAEILATEIVAPAATDTLVALSAAEESLLAGLGRYTLAAEPLVRQSTTVGDALLAGVCVNDRREVPTLLRPIMRALANGTAALPEDVQAVGVRMLDCNTGRAFVIMAVDRQSALDHAAGTLPYVDFRQRWQPQR